MQQANCSRKKAAKALKDNENDLVNASKDLLFFSDSRLTTFQSWLLLLDFIELLYAPCSVSIAIKCICVFCLSHRCHWEPTRTGCSGTAAFSLVDNYKNAIAFDKA